MPTKEIRQYCAEQVRSVNRERRTIDIVASDFSLDSYGTRLDPNGWDLDQFRKNPVILACHNSYSFAVAKALPETVRIENGELRMTIQFPDEGKYPDADIAFNLYADGFMRGVSVGFFPFESENIEENGERVCVFRKQRLDEVSLVAIPSNGNALAQRAAKLEREDLLPTVRKMTEQLEEILAVKAEKDQREVAFGDVMIRVNVRDLSALEELKAEAKKFRTYFEKKQPVNRTATKVLARYFKMKGVEQPAEEIDAWERMGEMLGESFVAEKIEAPVESAQEAVAETVAEKTEEVAAAVTPVIETPEAPVVESATEVPAVETPVESPEAPVEVPQPEPNPTPAVEAPQPERKASVHIPLPSLVQLRARVAEVRNEALVKASREGVPRDEWADFVEAAVRQYLASLTR